MTIHRPITDQDRYEVVCRLADADTVDQIAAALGQHREWVLAIAGRFGYPTIDLQKLAWQRDLLAQKPDVTPVTTGEVLEPATWTATEAPAVDEPDPTPPPATPAALAVPDSPEQELRTVPVDEVYADPDNPREELDGIEDLAASIEQVGLLQPIVVRQDGDRLVIIAGHRRYAAVTHLGWKRVDVVVRLRPMRPADRLAAMLIENSHRRDLDPIEEARGIAHLREQLGGPGISVAIVAKQLGRSQSWVAARTALLSLDSEQQRAVRAGDMNLDAAVRIGRENSGRVRDKNTTGHPHLGVDHDLAPRAQARCKRLGHRRKGRNSVGGVACGACWEAVIRANERESLHGDSVTRGACVICDSPVTPRATSQAVG